MNFSEMDGYEFEDYISGLLKKMGFTVEQTAYTNDGGIDIIAFYDRPIFYGKYIIQCKNWQGTVGAPEIRDLYGVVTDQRANKGILITPSDFTEQAYEFAKGKNIELINGLILKSLIDEVLDGGAIQKDAENHGFPDGFNIERYEYLVKKISDDCKNDTRYIELKNFLRQYVKNEDFDGSSSKIIDKLIQNQDGMIQKCYNTKVKQIYKKAALLEKANYYLLIGKLEEALELILDNSSLFRYDAPQIKPYLYGDEIRYWVDADVGRDVLSRNLYVLFDAIGYFNGVRIIDKLPKWKVGGNNVHIVIEKDSEKKLEELQNYQDWNDNKIYVVGFHVEKRARGKGYSISGFNAISTEKLWIDVRNVSTDFYGKVDREYFQNLDKIFLQHGYEI